MKLNSFQCLVLIAFHTIIKLFLKQGVTITRSVVVSDMLWDAVRDQELKYNQLDILREKQKRMEETK